MQETEDIVTRLRQMSRLGYWPLLGDEAATTIATLRAEVDKLRAELKLCGKDNCMGRRVEGVTQWVTEQAKDAAVAEARAEVEGLRADAERYRWLRETSKKRHDFYSTEETWMVSREHGNGTGSNYFGEKIDAAIDAAKAGKKGA